MKYLVTINGKEQEIIVDGERVTVDGRVLLAHLRPVPGTPLRHLLIEDQSLTMSVERGAAGQWKLGLQGSRFEIEVIDERTRHIRSLTAGAAHPAGAGQLKAPMPGLVVRVSAVPGQQVAAGQGLVVLEAMKMENELRAGSNAVVRSVLVQPGQAVDKGQVLVELDGVG